MTTLNVKNMTCGHCVSVVTSTVQALDSQATVQVDLQTGRVDVGTSLPADRLVQAITEAGYPAAVDRSATPAAAPAAGGCGCSCSCAKS